MDEKFRKRIEHLVNKAGGQSAFARATNMSLGAIQRYLKGGDPTRLALIRLCEAGGVSMSWLIYGEEGKVETSSDGKQKVKMYGFAETDGKNNGWQEPFKYRVRSELAWPDTECFAVIAGDDTMHCEGIRKDFTCFASPNTRPQPGDVVFIRSEKGEASFRKYVKEDHQFAYLIGYSKPKKDGTQNSFEEKIPQNEIDMLAPVVFVKRR